MYGPKWSFLLIYGSHDMRHGFFRGLTVVNGTPRIWGVTFTARIVNCLFNESVFLPLGGKKSVPKERR